MKIKKIKHFKFRTSQLFVAVAIISSLLLNGCSGCSPSGIKERQRSYQTTNDKVQHGFVKPNEDKNSISDTEISPIVETDRNPTFNNNNNNQASSIADTDGVTILSWNLEDFGKSKSDEVINFILNSVRDFDIVAVQEVVAGYGGAQAIARLNDALNRKGSKWDYRVSDPTSGENSYKRERYAFLWKPAKVSLIGQPWLEIKYTNEINREPFFATFKLNEKLFTIVNFHAITKEMQPETEIKYFKFLPEEYPDKNLIFCGDFNCPQSHTVFNPLKSMGYKPIFINQKTSLKKECINDECLNSEFDNMFYNSSKVNFIKSGVVLFYKNFLNLSEARKVSDHIPIYFQFSLN